MASETKVIEMYGGKVLINFTERDWGGNKIHCYTDSKGNKLISVTKITGTIDKSNALIIWATRLMGKYLLDNLKGKTIDEQVVEMAQKEWRKAKDEAADIGTQIHDWIEMKIKGLEPTMPENDKVKNGVFAFLKWQNENKIKFIANEQIVYSKKYNFVGKFDAIIEIKKKKYLIDYKSSKAIYPEFYLQTAAYQLAYEEEHGKTIDGRILIHLGKDDGVFESIEINDYEKDKKAFIGLLETKKRLIELDNYGF
jgi:CRISPR/Cas system-associated exonuclease Cas4 (RecB family)